MSVHAILLTSAAFFRYNRLLIHTIFWAKARSILPSPAPTFSERDVTVVIPTICTNDQLGTLRRALEGIDGMRPRAIIVVTPQDRIKSINTVAGSVSQDIKVVESRFKSKRHQVWLGIASVRSTITVLADDDVEWQGEKFFPLLLAPFNDSEIGAVGTWQRVKRKSLWNFTEFLGALYIARRNFETSATVSVDGGLSCLSGRTQAIRTCIVQNQEFRKAYCGEKWCSRELNPDDDNFITRWCYDHRYKIQIQNDEKAVVYITLETTWRKYMLQCVRWERSRLRHTITLLRKHSRIWKMQPWSMWALYIQAFFHSLGTELVMVWLWSRCKHGALWQKLSMVLLVWGLLAKYLRAIDHYKRRPVDTILFPVAIIFGYLHGFIKIYAFCTLYKGRTTSLLNSIG